MAYSADTFVADEQPTTAKWNKLWTNDASFNDGTGFASGIVFPDNLDSTQSAISWAWQDWTPTLANLTLGNGTRTSRYIQIGKNVYYRFIFTLGTTSAVGSIPTFTLPVTPRTFGGSGSGSLPIGIAHYEDNAVNSFEGMVYLAAASPTTTATLVVNNAAGAYVSAANLSATVPHTWGTGDEIRASGMYEAA